MTFDLAGALRRIRRLADLSQRELARACGISQSAIARAERNASDLPTGALVRAAAQAGLTVALVDGEGQEVAPMSSQAVRDRADRRFPAHLDTRYSDQGWWHDDHHYGRARPWYTFDRDRRLRDAVRRRVGTPEDHQLPQPGDSPEERAAERAAVRRRRRDEDRERRCLAGESRRLPEFFECHCLSGCDDLEDWSGRPVHAEGCPCSCDVG
ncbi:helix-turn-helix domain-containing protein [Blastococcus haudaquaticus]|uniref:Helix-turn-helix domain-containing protein n=1 Tax=Blastococcus haudaquaticus TaxID=1938745 RepID=A0A286GZD4_9ACTN|nr:helix-turn-helix transcriptional regulator [Blastococcus haudaquaticus]SOE00566.1 Helix-turn-helix domain-containing protein [Blastococcus haudaquaticus]